VKNRLHLDVTGDDMIKTLTSTLLALTFATTSNAETLDEYLWEKRPVVVFANTPNDLLFKRQMELLEDGAAELAERDVIVIVDTDVDAEETTPLRKKLRPRVFQLVLIGKDGQVKLRKPRPWTVRELSRVIDKMPMRQQELRQRWER
jgi:hypothetical protein